MDAIGSYSRREHAGGTTERPVVADRVLAVLAELTGHADGASLDEFTKAMGGSKPKASKCPVAR